MKHGHEVGKSNEQIKLTIKKVISEELERLISEEINPVRHYFKECQGGSGPILKR